MRLEYHEDERNGFKNVWLDKVTGIAEPERAGGEGSSTDPDESAWNTAIEAAPWVLGTNEPDRGGARPRSSSRSSSPSSAFVAEDIRHGGEEEEITAPEPRVRLRRGSRRVLELRRRPA